MSISQIKVGSDTHDVVANGVIYATCDTAADTAAKVAEVVSGNFRLFTGARVIVKFTNANSASNPTLNVAGTGAKAMYRYGTTVMSTGTTTSGWIAGAIQAFTYDGTNWVQDYWNNTTYSNAGLGQGYATCTTAAATAAKVATLSSYKLVTGGIVAVRFSYDVPASATLNVNSTGAKAIYYRNAAITAGVIKAGDIATFVYSTYYRLIAVDRDTDVTHPTTTAYTSGNTTTSISGSGGSGTIKIPQITVDANGHVTAAADESVTITMPTIPAAVTVDSALSSTSTNPVQNKVVNSALNNKQAKITNVSVTLPVASWAEQSDGSFAQTVTASGVTTSNNVVVDCALSGSDIEADIAVLEGWGCVNRASQASDSLTFYCYGDVPTVAIPLNVVIA